MPAVTTSETWDAAWTLTDRVREKRLTDNITDAYPTLDRLKRSDALEIRNGGSEIQEDLLYGLNSLQWFGGYDTLNTDAVDGITACFYSWAYGQVPVTISMQEEMEGRTSSAAMRITEAKRKQSMLTMLDGVNAALLGAASGKAPLGLQDICSESNATVGGIDDSSNTWWQNRRYDYDTEGTAATRAAGTDHFVHDAYSANMVTATVTSLYNAFVAMGDLYRGVAEGNDKPDVVITTQHVQAAIESIFESTGYGRYQIADGSAPGLDGRNATWRGLEIIGDNDCPGTGGEDDTLFMLNTKYLKFKIQKGLNMKKTPFREPTNQFAQVAYIVLGCQLTTNNRRRQGVMYDIDPD